jgi:GAF domain-containing protein
MSSPSTLNLPLPEDDPCRTLLQQALQRARTLLAAGEPPRQVLAQLTAVVESLSPDAVASILLIDSEGLLRNGASPNLPADYLDAIDRLRPDPAVGTCAAAAATGEVVVTPDFQTDARWSELRHLPMALGYQSAWSQPIKDAQGRVLGTFGTYFRSRREPTPRERRVVELLAGIAAEAISLRAA